MEYNELEIIQYLERLKRKQLCKVEYRIQLKQLLEENYENPLAYCVYKSLLNGSEELEVIMYLLKLIKEQQIIIEKYANK